MGSKKRAAYNQEQSADAIIHGEYFSQEERISEEEKGEIQWSHRKTLQLHIQVGRAVPYQKVEGGDSSEMIDNLRPLIRNWR